MKVLHIETGMHLYGGPQQVVYLLQQLQDEEIENVLVCPDGSAIAQAAPPLCGISLIPETKSPFTLIKVIRKVIHQHKPDLIHVHSRRLAMDVIGGIMAKVYDVPAVISRRVDNSEPPWLAKWKYSLYCQVIAISDGIRDILLSEGLEHDHVLTIRSAVDESCYQHDCNRDDFVKTYNLDNDVLTIAVIAQLIERKGHRYLLEILPRLEERFPKLKVLFFGQGALLESLKSDIAASNITSVQFEGFRDDLAHWLPCIDLVVHPADKEGLGVSLLQAAAAAIPLIASKVGGIPEIVRDQVNGILIQPGDTDALEQAIIRLLADHELRKEMGYQGRKIVHAEFSVPFMAQKNLQVYRQVLALS